MRHPDDDDRYRGAPCGVIAAAVCVVLVLLRQVAAVSTVLDWSGRGGAPLAQVGDPKPCVRCGQPALLRHPVTRKPCHKACEEGADGYVPAILGPSVEQTAGCPLCSGRHSGCEFAVGSLGCVRADCDNPHHRAGPS